MDVQHEDGDLEAAESDPDYRGKLDRKIVRGFRKTLTIVRQLPNEVELRRYPSLHYEKLHDREPECSIRLNIQWRVIFVIEIKPGANKNVFWVRAIEDYHK